MYSRLDAIFKTQLRHAEPLDTRQAIRRHDQPDQRKKNQEREQKGDNQDLWEDKTTLGVQNLKVFLEQLAQSQDPQKTAKEDITLSAPARQQKTAQKKPQSRREEKAQKATQAYQRTYRATHSDKLASAPPPAGAIPDIELTKEETRLIHQLIKDLEALAARHIEELTIHKGESFLQSLVDAVKAAR